MRERLLCVIFWKFIMNIKEILRIFAKFRREMFKISGFKTKNNFDKNCPQIFVS